MRIYFPPLFILQSFWEISGIYMAFYEINFKKLIKSERSKNKHHLIKERSIPSRWDFYLLRIFEFQR